MVLCDQRNAQFLLHASFGSSRKMFWFVSVSACTAFLERKFCAFIRAPNFSFGLKDWKEWLMTWIEVFLWNLKNLLVSSTKNERLLRQSSQRVIQSEAAWKESCFCQQILICRETLTDAQDANAVWLSLLICANLWNCKHLTWRHLPISGDEGLGRVAGMHCKNTESFSCVIHTTHVWKLVWRLKGGPAQEFQILAVNTGPCWRKLFPVRLLVFRWSVLIDVGNLCVFLRQSICFGSTSLK